MLIIAENKSAKTTLQTTLRERQRHLWAFGKGTSR